MECRTTHEIIDEMIIQVVAGLRLFSVDYVNSSDTENNLVLDKFKIFKKKNLCAYIFYRFILVFVKIIEP